MRATMYFVLVCCLLSACGGSVGDRPSVVGVRPADGETGVFLDQGVGADLSLPNAGVDIDTLTAESVRLVDQESGFHVPAQIGTSGGFDSITLDPDGLLKENTTYAFEVTEDVQDLSGASFVPYSSTFTTGTSVSGEPLAGVAFTKQEVWSDDTHYTALAIGPDGKLYAGSVTGDIKRFVIEGDGTLTLDANISVLGGGRLMIGLEFDPAATAGNLVAWVTHTELRFEGGSPTGDDWTGKLTRLSGPILGTVQDYVVGLPRSAIDHVTNGIDFGPDGALYLSQGSNSGMGGPDTVWGWRPERLLTAAILRIDPSLITTPPLDVKTEGRGDLNYDPFAPDAPVTIFASGVRNAYDLEWHASGQLFVPTNGSAANNNVPRTPGTLPASCSQRLDGAPYDGPIINNDLSGTDVYSIDAEYKSQSGGPSDPTGGYQINQTRPDWLFSVVSSGYYGHPNPTRCEWVMAGGDDGSWPASAVPQYEDGTPPDPNYQGFVYAFPKNASTNGIIEYESETFGGNLAGKLLVTRFSLGNDIIIVTPGASPSISAQVAFNTEGLTGFVDPLTLVEDPATGNIYVSEFARSASGLSVSSDGGDGGWLSALQSGDSSPRITLLTPKSP